MHRFLLRQRSLLAALASMLLVVGCTLPVVPEDTQMQVAQTPVCTPVSPTETVTGNWLSVRSQKGVAGELRTLFTLQADGSMAYTEQLKRSGKPSQGLSETGCWRRDGQTILIQTYESNGNPVDVEDPIYTNRYGIITVEDALLRLQTPDNVRITARRMSPGYRLPF